MSLKSTGAGDASTGFYNFNIDQSLRFDDGDNAYLNITPSSTGNQKTFTYSCWVKLGNLDTSRTLLAQHTSGTNTFVFRFDGSNNLQVENYVSSYQLHLVTDAEFRDVGAWYNVVLRIDTTQSTSTDRARLYVNGTEQTSFSSSTYPSQNTDLKINSTNAHHIGARTSGSFNFDGYLTDINFIDGQSLAPTSFGETKAGIWIPKDTSSLTFGTNGFRLKFQDSSALGDDTSGNGNDFSSNGLAATDVVLDSPTNNWATMNPLDGNGPDMQEGNLKPFGDTAQAVFEGFKGTFPMSSGKWYWEVNAADVNNLMQIGITPTIATAVGSSTNLSYHTDAMIYNNGGTKAIGTGGNGISPSSKTTTSYGASYTDGDIIGVALDLDSSTTTLTFYKNNSSQGTAFSSLGESYSDEFVPLFTGVESSFGIFNFGQDSSFAGTKTAQGNTDDNGVGDFYYSPPSGYLACCSANLPDPGIDPAQDEEPADHFNTVLYSGNSGTQNVTGVGFQPDWVWIKPRNTAVNHVVHTSTFANAYNYLIVNRGDIGENTNANFDWFKSFDSDGFTVAYSSSNGTNSNNWNGNYNYVSWNWLAGGSASSNSDGDITSSVSANTKAGFSIVTWTAGTGTVGHGLDKTPEIIIEKKRGASGDWLVQYTVQDGTNDYLRLNTTASKSNGAGASPTATVFTPNTGSSTVVAYCFHSVDGFSKVGRYTSTNNADGPYIYLGFRPAWVMVKNASTSGSNYDWAIYDNKRSSINPVSIQVEANQSSAEQTTRGVPIDFLSNGFKPKNSYAEVNGGSSNTYIYLAFAEQPFKYSNAR